MRLATLCVLLLGMTAIPGASNAASPASSGVLLTEPRAGDAAYVMAVQRAKHAVDVNSYLLSDRALISALVGAARRGVLVRVIVAGNPYGDTKAVAQERAAFTGSKVSFHEAPARFDRPYTFDHAKYLVVDPGWPTGEAILGSSNLTYSGLGGENREYNWETFSPSVVKALAQVFEADWTGKRAGATPRGALVLSPGAAPEILGLIDSSRRSVEIETEEFGRVPAVTRALEAALRRHESVRIVVPASISSYDRNQLQPLIRWGAKVVELRWPYVHAKLIIADGRAFIGSQNFSESSMYDNREVGVVLNGPPVQTLLRQFGADFAGGRKVP